MPSTVGFIRKRGFAGFPVARQRGRTKLCPRIIKYLFSELKYSKNINDDKTDMTAALFFEIYSLLLSQLPFSSLFVSSFVFFTTDCTNNFFGPLSSLKKGPLKLQKGPHWALIGQFLARTLNCRRVRPAWILES